MGIEAQRKSICFFSVSYSNFWRKILLYTARNHFETWPHWSRFGDSLRSGRGSLAVQPPWAALDSTCKWPGCLPDISTGPWVELGRWMICQGMDLFLDLHWWKQDDPTKVRSVPSVESRRRIWGVSGFFLCFPRSSWAHPSLCLFAPPW